MTFVLTGGEDHALVGTFEPADVPDGWTVIGTVAEGNDNRPAGTVTVDGELFESPHSMDVAGHHILVVHDLGDVNTRSIEGHEIVVHGFTHREEMKTRGDTLIVNPGEACGWLYGPPSAAVRRVRWAPAPWVRCPTSPRRSRRAAGRAEQP